MKRILLITVILTAMLLCLASCEKGEQGEVGPQGEPGKDGVTPTILIINISPYLLLLLMHRVYAEYALDVYTHV